MNEVARDWEDLDELSKLWGLPRRQGEPLLQPGPFAYFPRRLGTLVRYEAGRPEPPVFFVWQEERRMAGDFGSEGEAAVALHPAREHEPKSYRMTHQRALVARQLYHISGWLLLWLRMNDRPWCDGIQTKLSARLEAALQEFDLDRPHGCQGFAIALAVEATGERLAVSGFSMTSPVEAASRAMHRAVQQFESPSLRCDSFQWLPLELRKLARRGYL